MDCAVIDSFQKMLVPSQVKDGRGILIPPAEDMRITVDKVARFVASIKPRLERVIGQNAGMRSYSFLNATDPYHAYYQQRLSDFRAQNQNGWSADEPKDEPVIGKRIRKMFEISGDSEAVAKRIRKMYEIGEDSKAVTNTVVVSPVTGELITLNKLTQHMQDPKYKEQKERLFAKIRETTPAEDDKIIQSFYWVARERPDIFRTTEEEVCYAVMKEIDPFLIFDGPERRLDVSLLVPEDRFLARHSRRPTCVIVYVPEKVELLEITVESLSESVGSFKEKIAREIEVPACRQKLERERTPGHFKDDLSLAYYNVTEGDLLSVSW